MANITALHFSLDSACQEKYGIAANVGLIYTRL
jgi:hypothetical protein